MKTKLGHLGTLPLHAPYYRPLEPEHHRVHHRGNSQKRKNAGDIPLQERRRQPRRYGCENHAARGSPEEFLPDLETILLLDSVAKTTTGSTRHSLTSSQDRCVHCLINEKVRLVAVGIFVVSTAYLGLWRLNPFAHINLMYQTKVRRPSREQGRCKNHCYESR